MRTRSKPGMSLPTIPVDGNGNPIPGRLETRTNLVKKTDASGVTTEVAEPYTVFVADGDDYDIDEKRRDEFFRSMQPRVAKRHKLTPWSAADYRRINADTMNPNMSSEARYILQLQQRAEHDRLTAVQADIANREASDTLLADILGSPKAEEPATDGAIETDLDESSNDESAPTESNPQEAEVAA